MARAPFNAPLATVVDGVTCDVQEAELFGLLGPNGAGKTTLFRMLAGLLVPDEGRVLVGGHDVALEPDAIKRVLTMVGADERSLEWRLTARQNLDLFASLHGLQGNAARDRAVELLGVVGLADTGDKLVGAFSSGMRQRLLIARALVSRPRVLLLDEPTRSLDPISARSLRQFLREEICGRQRCTVLLATHNAEEALDLCDRVAVLNKGRLLAVGRASDLARQFGDERYRVWVREPGHAAVAGLEMRGLAHDLRVGEQEAGGWTPVDMLIPGGLDASARVIEHLARTGVAMARMEAVGLSLAELIERIVGRHGAAA